MDIQNVPLPHSIHKPTHSNSLSFTIMSMMAETNTLATLYVPTHTDIPTFSDMYMENLLTIE